VVTQDKHAARGVRQRLPDSARPWLWIAAIVLAPVGLLNLWLLFSIGYLGTETIEESEAYRSVTNPWVGALGLSAVVIVTCAIGSRVLHVRQRAEGLATGLAALSLATTTAWLAFDVAVLLGFLD
jgi:hypothetical protein